MGTQQETDYKRIAASIEFLKANYKNQPGLDEVAAHVHLSPFHFQRMFQDWAGVTPKRFLQYLSIEHAKAMLKYTGATLADTAFATGLSGTGRLHDSFVRVEGMTPGEYKNGGESLQINYSFAESSFGSLIIASTKKGICYLVFAEDDRQAALNGLLRTFPNAGYTQIVDSIQQNALSVFGQEGDNPDQIKLHLKGSQFQLKVWGTLLKIPSGGLSTYATVAQIAGHLGASRAVGTAIGKNPVAFLIPCHRVIRSTGEIGQYHWGAVRKQAIIGWEAAKTLKINN